MPALHAQPDVITFNAAISACEKGACWEAGWLLAYLLTYLLTGSKVKGLGVGFLAQLLISGQYTGIM